MQGLIGLLFPVLLMLFALAMERVESRVTAPARRATPPPADDDQPDVETLATIGLPIAVDLHELDHEPSEAQAG
ncbi:hypothetical protein P0W64_02830 [Tsukamurella sp. 8F]|uniref:hypothetical protein n=1 Tax=unclassified Tsukamurella TaxID=2633480 RepID=UPI0023B9B307|nr:MULTISPECIES: hypothetical protein [unclassified Tsukamurella]MDF0529608.1 hypothetical protein [Tsukamurella sp. 8J]MDF0585704.1 hypothetical protein [Tsukamurella sp. 8F]